MTSRRRVLVVNPNTDVGTTVMMTELVRTHLSPTGIAVEGLTMPHGPSMIVDPWTLAAAARHVVEAVQRHIVDLGGRDTVGVIVGAIGDPGRAELAAALDAPVVGIGQASLLAASAGGRRFGMATSTPLLTQSLAALVEQHRLTRAFTGVRLTESDPLVLATDPERQLAELATAVRACRDRDGAEVVIIAGGPLSRTARRLADLRIAEIIEPLPSAATLILHAMGDPLSSVEPGGHSPKRTAMVRRRDART